MQIPKTQPFFKDCGNCNRQLVISLSREGLTLSSTGEVIHVLGFLPSSFSFPPSISWQEKVIPWLVYFSSHF